LQQINLIKKRYTKFHQNRPSVMEDIPKNILVFFSGHTVLWNKL